VAAPVEEEESEGDSDDEDYSEPGDSATSESARDPAPAKNPVAVGKQGPAKVAGAPVPKK